MSKDITFKLNLSGLNALMKSGEMQGILNEEAARIRSSAGDGYETESAHPINFIAIASVRAASAKARRDNRKNKTLLKASGRG
jgi:hypothetical protein